MEATVADVALENGQNETQGLSFSSEGCPNLQIIGDNKICDPTILVTKIL